MIHCQGQKDKDQGHKVIPSSSTKTSNISCKRNSVLEIHFSYRNSRSPKLMVRSDF